MSDIRTFDGLKITIKKRHILEGRRCSRLYCPVNKAIRDRLRTSNVIVEFNKILINGIAYKPSHYLRNYMNQYDGSLNKNHVKGMTFILRLIK